VVRIVAKCVGGPLDGLFFSVVDDQLEITGFPELKTRQVEQQVEGDEPMLVDTGEPIDKYVKTESSQRDFEGEERALFKLLFDGHALIGICEFAYDSGS
jgi:hypothetical protein